MVSFAVSQFLNDSPGIEKVTMKYCLPGHSSIQEVDNVHSHIDRVLGLNEIWSIVSFLKLLPQVNKINPFRVIQVMLHSTYCFLICNKKN